MSSSVTLSESNAAFENDPVEELEKQTIDIDGEQDVSKLKNDAENQSKETTTSDICDEIEDDPYEDEYNHLVTEISGGDLQIDTVASSSSSQNNVNLYTPESSKLNVKISERVKQKSWYNVIYPSYKSRSETFKKLFKEVPEDQRLIVDYSCALQREILVHGRMFVSQHYLCFHANIFGWETFLCLKWKDVTAITKEKTALVIPNAILISTEQEKYFITSFAARDKTYLMLFRIWQNALMNKSMLPQEIWQCVHNAYGDQLGLTSDDEDYIDPNNAKAFSICDQPNVRVGQKYKQLNSSDIETDQSFDKNASDKLTISCSADTGSSRTSQTKLRMRKVEMMMAASKDNIPTDGSNSTDSEDESSIAFVCTAECTSMHEGRQLVATILPINVDSLLTLLFSKSKFFAEFHNMRKTTNMVYRDWIDNGDGTKCRTMNFTVAVTQAVGPKTSNITEVQLMRECSVSGQLYSIDITSSNGGIPYADSFNVLLHYCLVRTVDDHTMLSVYAQIKYTKSVWGVVKGFIEKNVWCGLEDFYKALMNALQSEYCIPPAKSKSRRNKRALTQKLSAEEMPTKARAALKSAAIKALPTQSLAPQSSGTAAFKRLTLCDKNISMANTKVERVLRSTFNWDTFSIFVLVLVIALILLNIWLSIQLYVLKKSDAAELAVNNKIQFEKLPLSSSSLDPTQLRENWKRLLNQQKSMHEAELIKWQGFVKAAIELLQKVKDIYSKFSSDLKHVNNHVDDEL